MFLWLTIYGQKLKWRKVTKYEICDVAQNVVIFSFPNSFWRLKFYFWLPYCDFQLPNNDNGQSFAWSLEGMNTRQHEQKNAFTFYYELTFQGMLTRLMLKGVSF